ncbi:MAG: nucleoside-diphosphate kinase [Sphingobacteriia bacterium]|jgi:nucleoside-diphosphate kinase|nr:nucleoside-diphosphate kinase [Sphingobacteriia bacterium]
MNGNLTLTILKPDAVANGHTGKIIDHILQAGFRIKAMKLIQLDERTAGMFYDIHRERSFFKELVGFMISGPVVPMILEKENAVADFRELIGATDPAKAAPGTIRNLYARSIEANTVHGSDSDENALREAHFFFSDLETL